MAVDLAESEAQLVGLIHVLNNVQITRYVGAVGLVILVYDHLLTLGDEVEYVWPAKNTIAKILFLVFRYMVPVFLTIHAILLSGYITISIGWCRGWPAFAMYLGWLSLVISNFLVLLRVYTIIPRHHSLVVWTFSFFVVAQITSFAIATWSIVRMISLITFNPVVGLCTFTAKPNLVGFWVVGLAFEVVIFFATWWNVLDRPRGTASNADVTQMLLRDGVVYFMVLFGLRTTNTVLSVAAPISLVGVFITWAGATITTSRLIINSRKNARQAIVKAQSHGPEEFGPSVSHGSSLSLAHTL